ncbi:MAG: pyridoxamine 5'-phosphate oxidase family protein [Dehalococcoidia bacterium]|nr:pyridoxamine 5'-phosphate oxidase family protein [Dehalococcoidia bacterium]
MNLGEYFDNTRGHGVLATADAEGKVNAAIYARPYFDDDKTALFIMAERLTHENLKANPWATYLFIESGQGYSGKRLYLKKLKEEQNAELLNAMCRKCDYSHYDVGNRYIVYFTVQKVLPLVGDK